MNLRGYHLKRAVSVQQGISLCLSLLLCVLLSSCQSYYGQAIKGQSEILRARVPLDKKIQDPNTDPKLRSKLQLAQSALNFAQSHMYLPANKRYQSYADIGRDTVVWSIVATPEFSLNPKTWCYPVVGCAAYRGFFKQNLAQIEADKLKQQGYDVMIGEVGAYSTLGWFNDPILNTFVERDDAMMIALIFHELAHVEFYLKGDTAFNEGFASAVEELGLADYLNKRQVDSTAIIAQLELQRSAEQNFKAIVAKLEAQLRQLYLEPLSKQEKRAQKTAFFQAAQQDYLNKRDLFHGYSYDRWFTDNLNNAKVASVSMYSDHVDAFKELFIRSKNNYPQFYANVRFLAKKPKAERDLILRRLKESYQHRIMGFDQGTIPQRYLQTAEPRNLLDPALQKSEPRYVFAQ